MSRSICVLALLLAAYVVFAAPAPEPFKTGWDKPVDPDGDCKFVRKADMLTIELPGTDHELAPKRERFNAPRLLRDIEGDFMVQVRVCGSFRPSAKSAAEGEEPSVAAGIVLVPADENCIRLEYRVVRRAEGVKTYAAFRMRGVQIRNMETEWFPDWKNWPQTTELEYFYLRLERRNNVIYPSINLKDKEWTNTLDLGVPDLPTKLKVGLAAYSTSTEPFKPRFDQFKLIRGRKKKL